MLLFICLCLLQDAKPDAPPPPAEPDAALVQKEIDAIKGTWAITKLEAGGGATPPQVLERLRFIITADTLTLSDGSRNETTKFKLNPTTTPKQLDIIAQQKQDDGTAKETTALGIIELNGDALKICFVKEGARPSAFETKAGSPSVLMELKRVPSEAAK